MSACHVVISLLEEINFLTLQIFLLTGISTSYQNLYSVCAARLRFSSSSNDSWPMYILRSTYDTSYMYHTLVTLLPSLPRFCPVACTFFHLAVTHHYVLWHTKTFFFSFPMEELELLLIPSRKTAFLLLTSPRLVNEN